MAELDGMQQNGGTPRTIEQLLHSESPTSWNTSATGRFHDQEEDHMHHGKKLSVIAKVKEKAKKWRQSLVRKKSGHDSNNTPSWGVALEDYEVEDEPENHGSLACESQLTPRSSKDNTPRRRQQRANSFMGSNVKYLSDSQLRERLPTLKTAGPVLGKSHSDNLGGDRSLSGADISKSPRAVSLGNHLREKHASPSKFALDALIAQRNSFKQKEKQYLPDLTTEITYAETSISKENEEEHPSNGKATTEVVIDSVVTEEKKEELKPPNPKKADEEVKKPHSPTKTTEIESAESRNATKEQEQEQEQQQSPTTKTTMTEAVSQKLAPAYTTVSEATYKFTSKLPKLSTANLQRTGEEHKWDKGVSVKEYLKNKLEPGEDEKALSQVITEVISPRRSPSEKGVVEKVKAAVTMLLQTEETSFSSSMENSQIPVSTNAHEVEEHPQGRILQAN